MATNDFLVFGGGAGANVITQVTYSGLTARTAGFSSGVAQSAQLNKVWRQSSIMAAVLAQFIADITGQDALDDGTTATLLTNLKAGVRAQSIGVVGTMRNAKMSVTAASASATFTADEIVVESALGGLTYRLPSFNKTINLATTGAGGMDTGSAPVNGYVALYAIYNPTNGASALLATNATGAVQPEVYGGANMPAGYTASALVSVWPTNGSGLHKVGVQRDRRVSHQLITLLNTNTPQASFTSLSVAGGVPKNAVRMSGKAQVGSNTTSGGQGVVLASDASGTGACEVSITGFVTAGYYHLMLMTAQTIYYTLNGESGIGLSIYSNGYEF